MTRKHLKSLFRFFLNNKKKTTHTQIGSFQMLINNDHALPYYLKFLPHYSKNFPRIAGHVNKKHSDLVILDIGANIGDTVALVRSEINCPIICIEGDSYFFSILKKNIEQFIQVIPFQIFLGDSSKTITGKTECNRGTLKITEKNTVENSEKIEITTLDNFFFQHKDINKAKLLKIDTDGYDLKIIRGGLKYINETKPIIFFEYDTTLLSEANDDGLSTLDLLDKIGYSSALFYDNYGRLILSTTLQNKEQVEQMHNYIKKGNGAFPYFDICLFHKIDTNLAEEVIRNEMEYFKNI